MRQAADQMVPSDAKIFFNDVLKIGVTPDASQQGRASAVKRRGSFGKGKDDEQSAPEQRTVSRKWKNKVSGFCGSHDGAVLASAGMDGPARQNICHDFIDDADRKGVESSRAEDASVYSVS